MTERYPLQWPVAKPRTKARREGNFGKVSTSGEYSWRSKKPVTIAQAVQRMNDELVRLGVKFYILSSNLVRNRDGSIRSGQAQPSDPGVALYFTLNDKPICMPCDTYTKAEQNIVAISKHIEATRAIERYGVASLAEMFTGFEALPSPDAKRHWRDVMAPADTLRTKDEIEARYRALARVRHPDAGGSDAMMAELNQARADALREIA